MSIFAIIFREHHETALICAWFFDGVVCQILNVFGITTNIINIVCFVKQGFKETVNVSLLGLAISDLCSLTTMVWTCVCLTPSVIDAELPFEPLELGYATSALTHFSFTRVSSCITAMITLERCLCITIPLKIKSYVTPRRTTAITVFIFMTFFTSVPVYVVNNLHMRFSPLRNRTLIRLVSSDNREEVERTSFIVNNFILPVGAFVIIVVCTLILSVQLKVKAKWRQQATIMTQDDKVSGRNKKTAKMVLIISILFIICFIPGSLILLVTAFLPSMSINGKNMHISMTIASCAYILESINASMNIFIYYKMSSNYRSQLQKTFFRK